MLKMRLQLTLQITHMAAPKICFYHLESKRPLRLANIAESPNVNPTPYRA